MIKVEIPVEVEEDDRDRPPSPKRVPTYGTVDWINYWSDTQGLFPSPINISITGSLKYPCPPLKWYNFDVYPHKVKLVNTGYTLLLGAKWFSERPYIEGGPFLEKYIFSQVHFHWGATALEGSDHHIDKRQYPAEMQVTFFKSEYLTQDEAFLHPDGVCVVCYMIKSAVDPDERLAWIISGFPKVYEAQRSTHVGPLPMSRLLPMFHEDYFVYWGAIDTKKGDKYAAKWLIPRTTLFASDNQLKQFRKLLDPWDVPNLRNYRPLQEHNDRIIFFISPHWNLYNSLLPLPRVLPEPSISEFTKAYLRNPWMFPEKNSDMWPYPDYNPKDEIKNKWALRALRDAEEMAREKAESERKQREKELWFY